MQFFRHHKLRKAAKGILREANNVLNMNRDLFDADVVTAFEQGIVALSKRRHSNDIEALVQATEDMQALLKTWTPTCFSPGMRELVDMLVVAFGVAMAFRTYFFQPFKIPTGSMQPTLYGIHSTMVASPDAKPGLMDKMPLKLFKWIATGTWYYEVVAPADGLLSAWTDGKRAPGYVLVSVAGKRAKIPDDAVNRGDVGIARQWRATGMADDPNGSQRELGLNAVQKGERIWAGYVTAGDQVFVNRLAWNFFPPKRDEVIVFSTSLPELHFSRKAAQAAGTAQSIRQSIPNLPIIVVDTPIHGLAVGMHYIKRLVGLPGEEVSIQSPYIHVNGQQIEGLPGMDRVASNARNADGSGYYVGYQNTGMNTGSWTSRTALRVPGDTITLGDEFLPMGDNTRNSLDGRFWGGAPRRQMLGPAVYVYWPISSRWGSIQ